MDRLSGVIPIIAMPFDAEGSVDYESLDREVDFLAGIGVRAIGFGFASEGFRLTVTEREATLRAVAARAAGRLEVVAHVVASSLIGAVDLARQARACGATLLMAPAPAVVQASEADLFDYFAGLARAAELPLIVQDAPALTGTHLAVATLVRLLTQVGGIVALKIEATPSAPKVAEVAAAILGGGNAPPRPAAGMNPAPHRPPPLGGGDAPPRPAAGVLGGAGGVDFHHELERGATGTMPGAAIPELFLDVLGHHAEGDGDRARGLLNRYLPLLVLGQRSLDTFLWLQKEVLRRRGVLAGAHLRAPCEHLEPGLARDLDALFHDPMPYPRPVEVVA